MKNKLLCFSSDSAKQKFPLLTERKQEIGVGVSPWRRAVSEASAENRGVLRKLVRLIPRQLCYWDRTNKFYLGSLAQTSLWVDYTFYFINF